jgi:hypothetical protein
MVWQFTFAVDIGPVFRPVPIQEVLLCVGVFTTDVLSLTRLS